MSGVDLTDRESLKALFKEVVIEVLQERRDLLEDAVVEAIEDIGMLRAIQEADLSDNVDASEFCDELAKTIELG